MYNLHVLVYIDLYAMHQLSRDKHTHVCAEWVMTCFRTLKQYIPHAVYTNSIHHYPIPYCCGRAQSRRNMRVNIGTYVGTHL